MKNIDKTKDDLAKQIYGKTKSEAVESGLCIDCNQPALENCYSEAGEEEFYISGLCEKCFDKITIVEE